MESKEENPIMIGRPKRRNLNFNKLSAFLSEIKFEAKNINQEWRHITAFGIYSDKRAVFKLASTQETGKMTQNEFYWNEAIHLVPSQQHLNVTVPRNFSSGFYGKLFYFIAEEFTAKPLITRDSEDTSQIASRIARIAKAAFEIRNLEFPKDCEFVRNQSKRDIDSAGGKLLRSSTFWARQVDFDLNKFLKVIEQSVKSLRVSPGHGDFSPRQLFDLGQVIGAIDGEHAGILGPLYYDPAWFYIRMRMDHGSPESEKQFLYDYKKLLNNRDRDIFWEELKPVLIQRYIGELWGAGKSIHKLKALKALGEEILSDNII